MNEPQPTVLVVDDNPDNIGVLVECLRRERFRVLVAQDGESALKRAAANQPDLILLDIMLPNINGFDACRALKTNADTADIPIIFLTALADTADKIRGFQFGAVDYLTKPFQFEEVIARVNTHLSLRELQRKLQSANDDLEGRVRQRTEELSRSNTELRDALQEVKRLTDLLQAENTYLHKEVGSEHAEVVGHAPSLQRVLDKVDAVARTDTTVLICGETGTGKEVIARTLHQKSLRAARPLVSLNCAAISAGLIESELFGHVKGAFTSASDKRIGRFELAHQGTLFLDEVSELPLEAQVKLLRVLQEQEFEPVGSSKSQKVDVRIIAASNRDLEQEVAARRFRADLYYRLKVFPLELPPLRERLDDLQPLVEHFIRKLSRKLGRTPQRVDADTWTRLRAHHWPGNIRELQNSVERALVQSTDGVLRVDWPLAQSVFGGFVPAPATYAQSAAQMPPANGYAEAAPVPNGDFMAHAATDAPQRLDEVAREHILAVLKRTHGIIEGAKGAAAVLGVPPSTVRHRMRKLGIQRDDISR